MPPRDKWETRKPEPPGFFAVKMERRYRVAVYMGHLLLVFAVFLIVARDRPFIYLLDEWGGLYVPRFVWPSILGLVGLILTFTRRPGVGMLACMVAFVLFVTLAAAVWMSSGTNLFTPALSLSAIHCGWTAIDLKAKAAELRGVG